MAQPIEPSDTQHSINDDSIRLGRELALLDTLFDHMPLGIAIYDRGFVLQRFNPTWHSILQRASRVTQDVQPGMHVQEISTPQQERNSIIARVMAGETIRRTSVHYATSDGDMWLDAIQSPLWENGEVSGFIEVISDVTERVLAEQSLGARVAFDELITTISTRFVNLTADDVDAGIEAALGEIGTFARVDRSYVFLFNAELTAMSYTHEWCAPGIAPVQDRLQDFPLAEVAWSTGHMLRREVLHIPRVADIPDDGAPDRDELQAQQVLSLLLVPMVYLDRPFGFLGFDAVRQEKSWADADIQLLTIVGEIFVNALQRRRTERVLREREQQYRDIFNVTSDGLVVIDIETGVIVAANPAAAAIHGYDGDELVGQHWSEIIPPQLHDVLEGAGGRELAHGSFRVRGAGQRKDGSTFDIDAYGAAFTYAGRPAVIGVVRDVSEQVQAMELLEARVEERTRELATLLDVSRSVTETLELSQLFERIFDQIALVLPEYGGGAILLLEGDDLVIVASRTVGAPETARREIGVRFSLFESSVFLGEGLALRPLALHDVQDSSELSTAYRSAVGDRLGNELSHVRSWMSAPLIVKDRSIGILSVSSSIPGYFTPRRVELVSAMSNQAGIAIENARLMEQAQDRAALEERQRLARELHDSVSQALYGIALGARTARALLDRDPTRVGEPLEYVLSLAEAGLAEMRALIFELRPESLSQEGLVAALEKQAASTRARHRLEVTADLGSEPPASLAVKEAFYRIAQEALHNTIKHARARHVTMRLSHDAQCVYMSIGDDGSGFDTTAEYPGHLGLRSMQERAARVDGVFYVESSPGNGARVSVSAPLQRPAAD